MYVCMKNHIESYKILYIAPSELGIEFPCPEHHLSSQYIYFAKLSSVELYIHSMFFFLIVFNILYYCIT